MNTTIRTYTQPSDHTYLILLIDFEEYIKQTTYFFWILTSSIRSSFLIVTMLELKFFSQRTNDFFLTGWENQ